MQKKNKLPVTVDWWRDMDSTKRKISYVQIESLESLTPDLLPGNSTEMTVPRNTTIDATGEIDISNILFPPHSDTERQIYEKNCERLQCPTSRKFGKTLDNVSLGIPQDDVNMAHYGLTSMGVRATAISISNLSQCSLINLQGNTLTSRSLDTLVSVMKKSPVTEINLSSTGISKFGPSILSKWISSSMRIKKLHIRDNKFDDDDGIQLFEALASSRSLIDVDLAQNNFCMRCGDALKKMLDENDVLEILDLSWNNIRLYAATSIAKGLKKNNGIKNLILSWNGLEDVGAKELGLSLKDNDCLQQIELVCNRITDSGFKSFMKSLEKNLTLKCIRLGRNLISQRAAEDILISLASGELKSSGIDTLDFTNIIFKESFQVAIDRVKDCREEFICLFGYEKKVGRKKMISYDPVVDTFQFLKSYVKHNIVTFRELIHKFNVNDNMTVTHEHFRHILKNSIVPIVDDQVDDLINYLDQSHDGHVDFRLLIDARDE